MRAMCLWCQMSQSVIVANVCTKERWSDYVRVFKLIFTSSHFKQSKTRCRRGLASWLRPPAGLGLQQQRVRIWEQSRAPFWLVIKDMLLQGDCEFIYTSLEKCICKYMYLYCHEQHYVFVLADLSECECCSAARERKCYEIYMSCSYETASPTGSWWGKGCADLSISRSSSKSVDSLHYFKTSCW